MDLSAIASQAVAAVNPLTRLVIFVSAGSNANADATRSPVYRPPVARMGQVQPLTTGDIRHVDALGIQGVFRSIYISGHVAGLVRLADKGGDLIISPDHSVWLVKEVPEHWPEWTRCIAVLQDLKDFT